jgi:uroporphyrin-3 C-methyltransferase
VSDPDKPKDESTPVIAVAANGQATLGTEDAEPRETETTKANASAREAAEDTTYQPENSPSSALKPAVKPASESNQSGEGSATSGVTKSQNAPKAKVSWSGRLALLLVLILCAGLGYGFWRYAPEVLEREATLVNQVKVLQEQLNQLPEPQAERELWQHAFAQTEHQVKQTQRLVEQQRAALAQEVDAMREAYTAQREVLRQFDAADQRIWRLAEARYLLRLANQRLALGGDTSVALGLLNAVDDSLQALDDPRLGLVRMALAQDREALMLVAPVDIDGVYFQMAAISERLAEAALMPAIGSLDAQNQSPVASKDSAVGAWQSFATKLNTYFSVQRVEQDQTWMSPAQSAMVRQSIRLLLAQAQVALLARDQALYLGALKQVEQWLGDYSITDAATMAYLQQRITELQTVRLVSDLPTLDRSLDALARYMGLPADAPQNFEGAQ